jgi:hypothetical protein
VTFCGTSKQLDRDTGRPNNRCKEHIQQRVAVWDIIGGERRMHVYILPYFLFYIRKIDMQGTSNVHDNGVGRADLI